jgi:arylsulfatase A-like enzyme
MFKKLFDSSWFYYSLAILLVLGAIVSQIEVHRPARPFAAVEEIPAIAERGDLNVVFILIDTLRADHMSMMGYERATTPTLDRLAETGVLFKNNVAQSSWTKMSMASLWTGTYPVTSQIDRYSHAVPEAARLPAEIFRDAGYETAGIFRNGWVGPEFGFSQGFDLYTKAAPLARKDTRQGRATPHALVGNDWDVTQSAIEFIRGARNQKFFLYIHYMDVHQYVFEQESALFGTDYEASYDNAIHWTDRNIGALVEGIEQLDLMKNTLVVIASDHGEAFYEHGKEGHAKDVYGEVIDTPLLFILPFFLDPGVVVEAQSENIDIFPTILDLAGLPPLEGAQGRSLVPLMMGQEDPSAGPTISHLERNWAGDGAAKPLIAVTDGDDRLIYWTGTPASEGAELYEIDEDPTEQVNVADLEPERTEELIQKANEYFALPGAPWGEAPPEVEIDDMKRGILQALGYVVGGDGKPKGRKDPHK